MAMDLVAKAGHGVFMVKENFKYAFRNVPMCFQDLNLLGIKVQEVFVSVLLGLLKLFARRLGYQFHQRNQ